MNRVIVAAVVGLLLLLTSCGSSDDKAAGDPAASTPVPSATATTPAPSPTVAATTSAPTIIDYANGDDDDLRMTKPSDTSRLTGAPADFTAFIAAELAKDNATNDKACTEKPQIYVTKLDPAGWASGGHFIPQCGGYASLWAKVDGSWKEVWSGQTLTDCKTLTKYAFPAGVAAKTCLEGDNEVPYRP